MITKNECEKSLLKTNVKGAKQFVSTFPNESVIISQDDKAKIPLGIPAVSRTFHSVQTLTQPVTIMDHDFPCGSKQKFIPSVYLFINPTMSNEVLRTGKLAIMIRPEYFLGTTSKTHANDLYSLIDSKSLAHVIFVCTA